MLFRINHGKTIIINRCEYTSDKEYYNAILKLVYNKTTSNDKIGKVENIISTILYEDA